MNQTGINFGMRPFIYFDCARPRGFHKTTQTGINSDMRPLYILIA